MADGTSVEDRFADRIIGSSREHEWPVAPADASYPDDSVRAWAEYLALRGVLRGLFLAPRPVSSGLVGALARACKLVDRRHSNAARRFVRTALPHLSAADVERTVLGAWRHMLHVAVESEGLGVRLAGRRFGDHFELRISPQAAELVASDRGLLFVTAHIGNWEASCFAMSALSTRPVYAVGKPPRNGPLSRRMQAMRELAGIRVLPRRGAMKAIPQIIAAGGRVGLLLDQRARKKPVIVPFFGHRARCDRTASVLLRRLAAPIVFYACYCAGGPFRYRLVLDEVLMPEDLAGKRPAGIATRINEGLERLILAQPDQYFWLHDRYRDVPARTPEDGPETASSPESVSNEVVEPA
ncbi:MAG: hypothetical protein E2O39_10445 [Planctomycetota bacterium]|nr:MAG: hypothetical protein E2O39_10445 [Planctomycetota bacterium]